MRIEIDGCDVHILPIVKGLVSESEKVRSAMENHYDIVGAALGPEDIEAFRHRTEIIDEDGPDLSDLELVYSHHLMKFGKIDFPTPAYSTLMDICTERSIPVVALDMDDERYSDVYCETISTMELLKETKLAKKMLKMKFSTDSAEEFADEWDSYINRIKGFNALSIMREDFIADSIRNASSGKESMLVVIEVERANGVIRSLGGDRVG